MDGLVFWRRWDSLQGSWTRGVCRHILWFLFVHGPRSDAVSKVQWQGTSGMCVQKVASSMNLPVLCTGRHVEHRRDPIWALEWLPAIPWQKQRAGGCPSCLSGILNSTTLMAVSLQLLQCINRSTSLPFSEPLASTLGPDCVDICTRLLCTNPGLSPVPI